MKRKFRIGSMQLSIEAIIVLVIAIVLLGLGIAFIKNFFAKGSTALLGTFDPINERCDVSSDNPVIPKEFQLKQGDITPVKICVYNNQDKDINNAVFKIVGCVDPNGNPKSLASPATQLQNGELKITSLGQPIGRGKTVGYKTSISVADSPTSQLGTYICNVQVSCDGSGCGPSPSVIGPIQMTFTVS